MPVSKRTVTEKRRTANQAAAAQSTGPRTEEGKRRSAFNSFKHGLYATQDATVQQAFVRSGLDLVEYHQLHQALVSSLKPRDAMQALVVEDLARLYCLKNISQRSSAESQVRQGELFRFQRETRRLEVQHNELAINEDQVQLKGWMWVDKCSQRFDALYELLDDLDQLARTARWDQPEESDRPDAEFKSQLFEDEALTMPPGSDGHMVQILLKDIYRGSFTWTGKRIQRLFAECAGDGASADDPRVAELRKLIQQERADVAEEHRLYEIGREHQINQPASTDHPDLQACGEQWWTMVNREFAFDRQIAAKLNLFMKLRREALEQQVDEEEVPEEPDTSPPKNDAGAKPGEATAPPAPSADEGTAAASGEPEEPAPAADTEQPAATAPTQGEDPQNTETNPKSTITPSESGDGSRPRQPENQPRRPETPPSEPSGSSGGGMR
jgi:hypothetical protein